MKRLLFIAGLLFVACGHSQKSGVIEFWQFWTDPQAKPVIDSIVDKFEKENPGWQVNITDLTWSDGHQKIAVAFAAGRPPDLLELGSDWIAEFAAANALSEIAIDTSKLLLSAPGMYNDKIYGKPWFVASRVLFFNKTLLDRAGVAIPSDWQALLSACRKIDSLAEDISGFGANSAEPHRLYKKFLPFVWSCGGDLGRGEKIRLDTPEMLRAFEFYGKLARCGRVETQRHLEDAFCEGKIGFLISGGWLLKRLEENPPSFEYCLSPIIPEQAGDIGWSFAGGEYLVIPERFGKKQAARRLMEYLTEFQNAQKLCRAVGFGFPPYKIDNADSLSDGRAVLFDQLAHSRSTPTNARWVYIESIIENMVEQVTLGQATAAEAIKAAQQKIEQTITN